MLREEAIAILEVSPRQFQRYLNGSKSDKLKGLIAICPEYFEPKMQEFGPKQMKVLKVYRAWLKKKRGQLLEKRVLEGGFPYD